MAQDYLVPQFESTNAEHVSALDELPFWSAPFGLSLLESIRIRRNMHVLDIGSGTGFPLLEIAERLGTGSRVVGLDPWIEAVERVKERIAHRKLANVEILNIPAEELPFSAGTFDLIVSNNGLNNVQDLPKVLSECRRVCKPDGQLVFTFNLPDTMIEFYRIFEKVLAEFGMTAEIEKVKAHIHVKRKTPEETEVLLAKAGFRVAAKKPGFFAYRFTDAEAMLRYYTIREFFLPAWQELLPAGRVSEVFLRLEQELNRVADRAGEIHLSVPFVCLDCVCG